MNGQTFEHRNLVIEARGLTKSFRRGERAVDGVDLEVPAGAALGLIGRNGAGKTTTMRMILALLRADAGTARVFGHNLWTAPASVRERVTYVSQDQNLYPWMTVAELCRFASTQYSRWDAGYAGRLARAFDVPVGDPVGVLSGGERRKASILLALAARPDLIVLDEPAAGLDPVARRELIDALVDILAERPDGTLLFSTHIISDLERIVDHVGIMDHGRMVVSGAVDDLKTRTRRLQLVFDDGRVPPGFRLPGAKRLEIDGPVVSAIVELRDAHDAPAGAAGSGSGSGTGTDVVGAGTAGAAISEAELEALAAKYGARLHLFALGLEDIFIETVGGWRRSADEMTEAMT